MRHLVFMIAALFAAYVQAALPSVPRWDRVVCLVEEKTDEAGKVSGEAGAAFIIAADSKLLLVTAAHNARFTTGESRLLFRESDEKSHGIKLNRLTTESGQPWRYHDQADLAVMTLTDRGSENGIFSLLEELAIPIDNIEFECPERSTAIEIVGFPMLLGSWPRVSPVVMNGHIASREMPVKAKWGDEQILFAFPTVGAGSSGGAVFRCTKDPEAVSIVGMCIGYLQDKAGFRLAKLIPGRVIVEFIRHCDEGLVNRD